MKERVDSTDNVMTVDVSDVVLLLQSILRRVEENSRASAP